MPPCPPPFHAMPFRFSFAIRYIFAIDIFTLAIDDFAFQIDIPFHFH
jgi:hypothetical protein